MPIPDYAAGHPPHMLIKTICKGDCSKRTAKGQPAAPTRYMLVSDPNWSKDDFKNKPISEATTATCLKCGSIDRATYNWTAA